MRVGLVQLTASDEPASNLPVTEALIREAAAGGARFVLTPEVTNVVSQSRARQRSLLATEREDATLTRLRAIAAELGVWLLIGSLAVKIEGDERFANRSLLVDATGVVRARYDKIHMFDVDVSDTETWRESDAFRPGERAVTAETPWGVVGLSICYDMRFPALYRALAEAGATILTAPAAFTVPTGRAHWETLLRARAIETGSFVLAPAQVGEHPAAPGEKRRTTWGHSLAVAPWGEVLADGGEQPGVTFADLDLAAPAEARRRIPALANARPFALP
ncbi:MAG: carbon-nitrogen hydrolase family protein [Rhodobacteraceae bacterium]|nr:MAG: carbon-nitrogen hydrolase family protein [Paracoccaceae bacterium]